VPYYKAAFKSTLLAFDRPTYQYNTNLHSCLIQNLPWISFKYILISLSIFPGTFNLSAQRRATFLPDRTICHIAANSCSTAGFLNIYLKAAISNGQLTCVFALSWSVKRSVLIAETNFWSKWCRENLNTQLAFSAVCPTSQSDRYN
jgi:hypothetical protein